MRIAVAVAVALLPLVACSKTAEPAALADFVAKPGARAAACVADNDGKRFVVEGHLVTNGDVTVRDGRVDLRLTNEVKDGEGEGPSFVVEAESDKHVVFEVANESADFHGGAMGSKGELKGHKLRTASGDVGPEARLEVVFDTEVIKHFQTGEITACVFKVVELRKKS